MCANADAPHQSAVRVAHDEHDRAAVNRRLAAPVRELPVVRVIVEVVLQVDHDATPVRDGEVPHGVSYHVEVLVRSGPEYVRDLPQVRLGDDRTPWERRCRGGRGPADRPLRAHPAGR